MATVHTPVSGTYNEKSKDSDTQASNKWGGNFQSSTDKGMKGSGAINKPKDSGE